MPTLNSIGKEAVLNHHPEGPIHLLKDVPGLAGGDAGTGKLIGNPQGGAYNLAMVRGGFLLQISEPELVFS